MNKTQIEWVKNPDGSQGYTWNPITGCLNHVNGLCKGGGFPCYAYKLANRRLKQRYLANANISYDVSVCNIPRSIAINDPFYPRFWEERLKDIQRGYHFTDWAGACEHGAAIKGIFCCDMGDLFGIGVPEEWTRKVLDAIRQNGKDRFYLLTKQPQRLPEFSPFPDNAWVGVTVTNTLQRHTAISHLNSIVAPVRFLSCEPLLSTLSTTGWQSLLGISWLILGACTGSEIDMGQLADRYHREAGCVMQLRGNLWTLRPRIEWVREIIQAADKAGVKVFLKDNLSDIVPLNTDREPFLRYGAAGELRLRQEMPVV